MADFKYYNVYQNGVKYILRMNNTEVKPALPIMTVRGGQVDWTYTSSTNTFNFTLSNLTDLAQTALDEGRLYVALAFRFGSERRNPGYLHETGVGAKYHTRWTMVRGLENYDACFQATGKTFSGKITFPDWVPTERNNCRYQNLGPTRPRMNSKNFWIRCRWILCHFPRNWKSYRSQSARRTLGTISKVFSYTVATDKVNV